MKTIISWMSFLVIFFTAGIMISCTHLTDKVLMDKHFKGNHELRRFNVYNETTKQSYGSYFLILGSYSSTESTQIKIRLCWKHPDDTYVFSEVPFNKIRLRIVNTDKPYINFRIQKFDWETDETTANKFLDNVELSIDNYVDYVIINCKESDFPADVNLKDLK